VGGIVVGLMGAKQSGKDTLAEFLVKDHGYVRLAFADVMRDALLMLDPWVYQWSSTHRLSYLVANLGWDRAKELYPEIRRLLQVFGTEVGREVFGETVWVDMLDRKVESILNEGRDIVVTDIRFPNEADMLTDHGAYLVRIERLGLSDTDQHASERAWRGIDADLTCLNHGTIEDLQRYATYLASLLNEYAA
jgi:hypothetical protein